MIIVPLTSKTKDLLPNEFILTKWEESGLNVPTAVKRGIYTISDTLVIQSIGILSKTDYSTLVQSIKQWLGII